jgi:hypothetical protein
MHNRTNALVTISLGSPAPAVVYRFGYTSEASLRAIGVTETSFPALANEESYNRQSVCSLLALD